MARMFCWCSALALLAGATPLYATGRELSVDEVTADPVRADNRTSLILLGTAAGPSPRPDRAQPATLLRVNDRAYLIDAGENVSNQLAKVGVRPGQVEALLISHLHFDHVLGLGPLMAYSWIAGTGAPMGIWGPPGTGELVARNAHMTELGADIFRQQLPPRAEIMDLFPVSEVDRSQPGQVFDDGVVRVTAVANSHYVHSHLSPRSYGDDKSLSFRFETPAGSIVFTGDTGPSKSVEALARDCDILVSEIVDPTSVLQAMGMDAVDATNPMRLHMELEHLTAAEVGKLAQKSGAKKLVITHFATGPSFDPDLFVLEIRKHYPHGEIILGIDLAEIAL